MVDASEALTAGLEAGLEAARAGNGDSFAQGNQAEDIRMQGDLAEAFGTMVTSQRDLVQQITSTAAEMRSSSAEILASSRSQERGASEQQREHASVYDA